MATIYFADILCAVDKYTDANVPIILKRSDPEEGSTNRLERNWILVLFRQIQTVISVISPLML